MEWGQTSLPRLMEVAHTKQGSALGVAAQDA